MTIRRGQTAIDMTTVTSVQFDVKRADQSTALWACAIASPTPDALVAVHTFATIDCPIAGVYAIRALLTVPGGVVPCLAQRMVVVDKYDLQGAS